MSYDETRQQLPPEGTPIRALRVVASSEGGDPLGSVTGMPYRPVSVGTSPDNDLVLQDRTISRYHLELTALGDGCLVHDLGSSNGS